MEIRGPKSTVKAKKDEVAWIVTDPEKSYTNGQAISNFIYGLAELEFIRLLETPEEKNAITFNENESITVTLKSTDKVLIEFTLSTRADGEDLLTLQTKSGTSAVIDADFLVKVPPEFRTVELPPGFNE